MHRCLNIVEIQSLIFENFRFHDISTLASLARTCIAFREASLDELWYEQETLATLVQVMPVDLWTVTTDDSDSDDEEPYQPLSVLTLTRPLEENDWPRYDYYARRIRRFGYTDWDDRSQIETHESVIQALSSYRPLHPLLPNLRAFFNDDLISQDVSDIPSILVPSLVELSITVWLRTPLCDVLVLLLSVAHMCPKLRCLQINVTRWKGASTSQFTSALDKLLGVLSDLQYFHIDDKNMTNCHIIHRLGALPELRRYSGINMPSNLTSQHRELLMTAGTRFPKLCDVAFTAQTLEIAAEVIELTQRRPLEHLHVTIETDGQEVQPLPSLARLFKSFPRHRCTSSLTSLLLSAYSIKVEDSSMPGYVGDIFRALFSLKALHTLHIDLPCSSELDDNWISDAAVAWPHLEELRLAHRRCPSVTLAGLIPLVRHCPELRALQIPFSAKPLDVKLLHGVANMAVRSIWLDAPPIAMAPATVFRCLVALFPNLGSLYCSNLRSKKEGEAWEKVMDMIEESVCGNTENW